MIAGVEYEFDDESISLFNSDQRYAIDCSKLSDTLGWNPQYNFEAGMAATVNWYLNNTHWMTRVTDGSYRGQRLGRKG